MYGFAKSERANIDVDEEKQFKESARIAELVKEGDVVEIREHEQEISK